MMPALFILKQHKSRNCYFRVNSKSLPAKVAVIKQTLIGKMLLDLKTRVILKSADAAAAKAVVTLLISSSVSMHENL